MDWKFVDSVLEKYRQDYSAKQNDLKDEIQNQLLRYAEVKDLYALVSESDMSQYKRFLEKNEEYIKENGYTAYMVSKTKNRTKLKYKQMIDTIILVLYAKFQKEIYPKQLDTLMMIGSNVYSSTIKECEKLGHKPRRKIPTVEDIIILALLNFNEKGVVYQEQNDAQTIYNAGEISKQVAIDYISNNRPDVEADRYQEIFDKQKKREINKKKDQNQQDKYSGIIDDQSTFIINQIKLQLLKIYDFQFCKFVGIEDNRQTEMCKSLSGQMFNLEELNVYSRYSALDKADVVYHTIGMVVGENLPPITNHKHACRSYIVPTESAVEIANEDK